MTRRIIIYEDTCGGGCENPLAAQLQREGMGMLRALSTDFSALEGLEVVTTLDQRIDAGELPIETLTVASREELASKFNLLASECDLTLLVAPELGGRLTSLSRQVLTRGGTLHGGDLQLIETSCDKLLLYRHLDGAGIPALPARKAEPGRQSPTALVQKPRFGAGSLGISTLAPGIPEREGEEEMLVTPLLEGQAVSVLCIAGGGSILPLDPCRQRLAEDGTFRYLGGSVPLGKAELSERARALALAAVASFRAPGGFIGIDLLLGENEDDDRVIELNPRPTTSYCALRRRSPVNLAQLSLDLLAGGQPASPCWPPHQESYNSEGRAEEAMNPATSMETAS